MAAPHWAAWLLLARPLSRPDPGGSSGARCCLPGLSLAHRCEADATSPVPAGAVTWLEGVRPHFAEGNAEAERNVSL